MSVIKFSYDTKMIAVLRSPAGPIKIGEVEDFVETKNEGGIGKTISMSVRLGKDLDPRIKKQLEKNPEVMSIIEDPSKPKNIIIIPDIVIPGG